MERGEEVEVAGVAASGTGMGWGEITGMGITGAWIGEDGTGGRGRVGRGIGSIRGRGAGGRGGFGGSVLPATMSLMSSRDNVSCSRRASASLCSSAYHKHKYH